MTAMTATPCGASSAAQKSGSTFCAALTTCAIGIPSAAHHVVFRDFDDQPAFSGHHRERGVLRRDDARCEGLPEDRIGLGRIRLPEEAVGFHQRVFARHAVDDDVDALVGALDAPEQRLHLGLARVIDAQRDRRAAGGLDDCRRLIDGLRPSIWRWLAFDASSRAVDGRAGFAERARDAAARAARRSGHEGHTSREWLPARERLIEEGPLFGHFATLCRPPRPWGSATPAVRRQARLSHVKTEPDWTELQQSACGQHAITIDDKCGRRTVGDRR